MRRFGFVKRQRVAIQQQHIARAHPQPLLHANAPQVGDLLPFPLGTRGGTKGGCVRLPLRVEIRKVVPARGSVRSHLQ